MTCVPAMSMLLPMICDAMLLAGNITGCGASYHDAITIVDHRCWPLLPWLAACLLSYCVLAVLKGPGEPPAPPPGVAEAVLLRQLLQRLGAACTDPTKQLCVSL